MARPISPLTHFILSQPRTVAVSDVIAAAKRAGMTTSAGNIHQVRAKYDLDEEGSVVKKGAATKKTGKGTKAKAKAAKTSGKTKRAPRNARPAAAAGQPTKPSDDAEKALKDAIVAVVLAHGTPRAQAVVDGVIATIRALREA